MHQINLIDKLIDDYKFSGQTINRLMEVIQTHGLNWKNPRTSN